MLFELTPEDSMTYVPAKRGPTLVYQSTDETNSLSRDLKNMYKACVKLDQLKGSPPRTRSDLLTEKKANESPERESCV